MPKITFLPQGVTVEFEPGQLPYHEHGRPESLLDIALHFGIPLEHACGGNCACTTCHVIVKERDSGLSPMEDCEEDRLDYAPGLTLHSRLGCQAVVKSDVVVEIPDWNRNYVSEGGGSINLGAAIPAPLRVPALVPGDLKNAEDALHRAASGTIFSTTRDGVATISATSKGAARYSLHWVPRDRDGRLNVDGIVFAGNSPTLAEALMHTATRYGLTKPEWQPAGFDWLTHQKTSQHAPVVEGHHLSKKPE